MNPSDLPQHGFQKDAGKLPQAQPRAEAAPASPTPSANERSHALFGTTVQAHGRFPILAFLFALLALGCAGLAYFERGWLLWGTTGCGAAALIFFLSSRQKHVFHFTPDGIAFGAGKSPSFLPYGEILEVFVRPQYRGRQHFPIVLLLADGFEILPAKLTVASEAVLDFLLTQPLGSRDFGAVPPLFSNFLRQQCALYRAQDIYVYRARVWKKTRQRRWNWVSLMGLSPMLAGALWVMLSFVAGRNLFEPLLMSGIFAAVIGAVFFVIGLFYNHPLAWGPRVKNWKSSILILSPGGLALSVADLQGELRWLEVSGVDYKAGAKIAFKVPGASIDLLDIFHWPIDHIGTLCQLYHANSKDVD